MAVVWGPAWSGSLLVDRQVGPIPAVEIDARA